MRLKSPTMLAVLLAQALVAPRAPRPTAAKLAPPIVYRIHQIPAPVENKFQDPKSGDLVFRIGGQLLHVHPPQELGRVEESSLAGKDGSVRVDYWVAVDPGAYSGQKIITDHPRRNLLAKAFDPTGPYRDAKNYVRSYYKDTNAMQMPMAPATVVQAINGKERELGIGVDLKTWWPNRVLVAIAVDDHENPTGYEFTDHEFLRLYDKGRPIEIGPYHFLGMVDYKTIAVTSASTVYLWRETGFVSARSVPPGYRFVAVNSYGDVLVRYLPDAEREEVWKMALLHTNTLTPLTFRRPTNSKGLLWRETQSFGANRRIHFSAFYGDVEKYYELAP